MTLITVFPYPDGHIISADSQETAKDTAGNEFKYSVLKLQPEKMGIFDVLIAGSGNGDAIDSFIEEMRQHLPTSKAKTLPELKTTLQSQLLKFRKRLHSVGDDSSMELIIAAHLGSSFEVWKSRSSCALSNIDKADMSGFDARMYRHMVEEFHPVNLPVSQLILLSLRVLDFARETSTCVDKPYSVVIVRDNGIHVLDPELVKQNVESITVFGAAVNKLLLACGDTSMRSETFDEQLKEFSLTTQHLRKEYLQQVGERAFMRAFEPGYSGDPISITPLGTLITVAVDPNAGIKIEVGEESKENREQRLAMMREADDLIRKSRAANTELARLIGNRKPIYGAKFKVALQPYNSLNLVTVQAPIPEEELPNTNASPTPSLTDKGQQ